MLAAGNSVIILPQHVPLFGGEEAVKPSTLDHLVFYLLLQIDFGQSEFVV